ncbi:hypothetical protein KAT92_03040 [Candidatus Babeliales bacterium]|nr:hypothetical protein [Candidatus Babeliales bacterium]
MNRNLKGLLIALAVYGTAFASTDNNKTHLNVRIDRDSVPAYTTFHKMVADKDEDRLGGSVEATGHYGRSVNASHLAKSFGADGTGSINVIAGPMTARFTPIRTDVVSDLILHVQGGSNKNALAGVLNFAPKQTVYGLRLDYFQSFDKWVDGLFLHVILPFEHMTNDINMTIPTDTEASEDSVKLKDLFTGKAITRTAPENVHTALKYAKMNNNSETGLGDIEARIGWNFLDGKKYHAGIHAAVVFPTGDEANEEFLWGAQTGDSKWGIGLGTDASALLWEEDEQSLTLLGCLQYKYLFEGDEKRNIGFKELRYTDDGTARDIVVNPIASLYYQVGEVGVKGLQPLANVSTLDVDVKPGSQIDGTVSLAYTNGGFTLDLGYNLFWKEAESVTLSSAWNDEKYGVARKLYDATAAFGAAGADTLAENTTGWIKKADLDFDGAATSSIIKHKVFTGVGYVAKTWEYPVMAGAGIAYELPSSNRNATEGYSFWVKLGASF